jgi:hypothetical protein
MAHPMLKLTPYGTSRLVNAWVQRRKLAEVVFSMEDKGVASVWLLAKVHQIYLNTL